MKIRRLYFFLLLPLLLSLSSCAHVISKDLREQADPALDLKKVLMSPPEQYKGNQVIWGGDIVRTTNQADGSTLIEVLQKPLDGSGEPQEESTASEGRFLVRAQRFMDPLIYTPGRKITVAGEIQGQQLMAVGGTNYRYPVVLEKQIYLWPAYTGYETYYPYPYYAYPGYYPWYPDFFFFSSFHSRHHSGRHGHGRFH